MVWGFCLTEKTKNALNIRVLVLYLIRLYPLNDIYKRAGLLLINLINIAECHEGEDMKQNIKLKGRLRNYMYWPMVLTILLVLLNIPIYIINIKSGFVVTGFTVIYFIVVSISYNYNKPVLVNELITFATQYGSVQKKLLEEFEIPYALLEQDGKILWVNQQFAKVTGRDKTYHKAVNGIFPAITKELLQKVEDEQNVFITMDERHYRVHLKKMLFKNMIPDNGIIAVEDKDEEDYLIVLYLFDETELKKYILSSIPYSLELELHSFLLKSTLPESLLRSKNLQP